MVLAAQMGKEAVLKIKSSHVPYSLRNIELLKIQGKSFNNSRVAWLCLRTRGNTEFKLGKVLASVLRKDMWKTEL